MRRERKREISKRKGERWKTEKEENESDQNDAGWSWIRGWRPQGTRVEQKRGQEGVEDP